MIPLYMNLGGFELILFLLIALIPIALTVNIIQNSRFTLSEKLLWILLIWLLPVLGILVYLVFGATSKAR